MQAVIKATTPSGFTFEIMVEAGQKQPDVTALLETIGAVETILIANGCKPVSAPSAPPSNNNSGSSTKKGGHLVPDEYLGVLRVFHPYFPGGREDFAKIENAMTEALSGSGTSWAQVDTKTAKSSGFKSPHFTIPLTMMERIKEHPYFADYSEGDLRDFKYIAPSDPNFIKKCAEYCATISYDFKPEDKESERFKLLLAVAIDPRTKQISYAQMRDILDTYVNQSQQS